jgi:hypothetical protein
MNTIVHFVLLLLGSSGFISRRSLSSCSPAQIDAERRSVFADMLALNSVSNNQTKRAGSAQSITKRTKRIQQQKNHWLD